jgi:type II secretory pathway component PulF
MLDAFKDSLTYEFIERELGRFFNRGQLNIATRQWLYDVLSFRAQIGSVSDAIPSMIARLEQEGRKSDRKRKILEDINLRGDRSGKSFAHSLYDIIPEDEFNLISAFEESSKVGKGLEKANQRLTQKIKHSKAISKARNIFILRLVLSISVLNFLGTALFGPLAKVAKPEKWPAIAQFAYKAAESVHIWVPVLTVIILVLWWYIGRMLNHGLNSKFRRFAMDNINPWNVHRDMVCLNFLESLVSLSTSHAENNSIKILIKATKSDWVRECLEMMNLRLKSGRGNLLEDNPILPTLLNDVVVSMGDGVGKAEFYTLSIQRLNIKIDEKFEKIEEKISLIGTLIVFSIIGVMFTSYFLVTFAAAKIG